MENERQQQIEEGRRQTLHVAAGSYSRTGDTTRRPFDSSKPKNKSGATGHEAFLKALVATGASVVVKKLSDGSLLQGVLKHTDRYTLTVSCLGHNAPGGGLASDLTDVVVYKHAIEEFYSITPKVENLND